MGVLPAGASVHHVCAWCLQRPGNGFRLSRTRVIENCELPGNVVEMECRSSPGPSLQAPSYSPSKPPLFTSYRPRPE